MSSTYLDHIYLFSEQVLKQAHKHTCTHLCSESSTGPKQQKGGWIQSTDPEMGLVEPASAWDCILWAFPPALMWHRKGHRVNPDSYLQSPQGHIHVQSLDPISQEKEDPIKINRTYWKIKIFDFTGRRSIFN